MQLIDGLARTKRSAAIRAAQQKDFTAIERLLKVLGLPFDKPALPSDAALPPVWAPSLEASCSP